MPDVIDEQQKELSTQGMTILSRAAVVKITDQASYNAACDLLQKEIIPFRRKWKEFWEPLKSSAWTAYKKIQDRIKEYDDPAEMAERTVKTEIRRWDDEQIRLEQERQRKAQEEAEKQAQEERLRAAIVAEEAGASQEEVSQIYETPVAVVAEPVQPQYARTAGISRRDNWKAKVNDLHALVKAAAKDKGLLAYLEPNQRALDARAKADRQTMNIPGVVPYNEAVIASRAK